MALNWFFKDSGDTGKQDGGIGVIPSPVTSYETLFCFVLCGVGD